jgi:energy-coupling factor transport system substrate-specific component
MGMMVAIIEVCKQALAFLPNIELTSFLMVQFTLLFGWRMLLVVPAVVLIEGMIYGFGVWWIMYLYLWPLLVLVTWVMRKHKGAVFWSIVSGVFGLLFGLFGALPYVVIGGYQLGFTETAIGPFLVPIAVEGGLQKGLMTAFTWWVAGIPWDIVHGVGNFMIMLLLYQPIQRVIGQLKQKQIIIS